MPDDLEFEAFIEAVEKELGPILRHVDETELAKAEAENRMAHVAFSDSGKNDVNLSVF